MAASGIIYSERGTRKKTGDMLMGGRWSRNPLTGFSKIDNQALIIFIRLPGEAGRVRTILWWPKDVPATAGEIGE
jgi:hypothetical protein